MEVIYCVHNITCIFVFQSTVWHFHSQFNSQFFCIIFIYSICHACSYYDVCMRAVTYYRLRKQTQICIDNISQMLLLSKNRAPGASSMIIRDIGSSCFSLCFHSRLTVITVETSVQSGPGNDPGAMFVKEAPLTQLCLRNRLVLLSLKLI